MTPTSHESARDDGADLPSMLIRRWRLLVGVPLACGLLAVGATYAMKPIFTARTTFIPPQQQSGLAASALASLGALSGLAGASLGVRTPADQYVAFLQSRTLVDRMVDRFDLLKVYDRTLRQDARKKLLKYTNIVSGKKDGLIAIEVEDEDPVRAADMANQYVDELRVLTGRLALTEAQQRRVFFESQLNTTRQNLLRAQKELQTSGVDPGSLKTEPKAAAESFARLRAEATAAEVKLQTLRNSLVETAPEVMQQAGLLVALRHQLSKLQLGNSSDADANYVGKYREFKYQETLFELFARQFELARLDESREGALIQVVDKAEPPELRSWPKRGMTAVATTLLAFLVCLVALAVPHAWRQSKSVPRH